MAISIIKFDDIIIVILFLISLIPYVIAIWIIYLFYINIFKPLYDNILFPMYDIIKSIVQFFTNTVIETFIDVINFILDAFTEIATTGQSFIKTIEKIISDFPI